MLGTDSDAVWIYSTEPQINNRNPLSLDKNNQRLTYNPFAKLPEVHNVLADTSKSDCGWALWTLFETLVGSHEEGDVLDTRFAG